MAPGYLTVITNIQGKKFKAVSKSTRQYLLKCHGLSYLCPLSLI